MFLSRFWGNAEEEGQEFRSIEVRGKLIALKEQMKQFKKVLNNFL